jgi:hypothetical protein
MKTNTLTASIGKTESSVSLHGLIDTIMLGLQPLSGARRNVMMNAVSPDIKVSTDENILSYVISSLLTAALSATQSECIRLGAASSGDYTVVNVQDNEYRFFGAVQQSLPSLQQAAKKMGGCISLQHNKTTGTLTSFRFYNGQQAA